jgi:hypothetical protein
LIEQSARDRRRARVRQKLTFPAICTCPGGSVNVHLP